MIRFVLAAALGCALAAPVWANARLTVLMDALRVAEVVQIMRAEGLQYADALDTDMLNGQGGLFWSGQIAEIYNPARMTETVRLGLETGLSDNDVEAALTFFDTERAQRIVTLENAARSALQDEAVEATTKESCASPRAEDADHLAAIDEFIAVNDLIERNVAGALNSNYRFFLGLADGGNTDMTEAQITAFVYAQEPEVRADTESWICAFLLMAYRPLPLEDIHAYSDFYATPSGRALNAALFTGYEEMYREISYALGRAVALNRAGDDI